MTHYNTFHSNEQRDCIFEDCNSTFSQSSMSRNHFNLVHKRTGKLKLRSRHLLTPNLSLQTVMPPPIMGGDQEVIPNYLVEDEDEAYEASDIDVEGYEENTANEELSENYYLQYYSDFLNRMAHMKFIPQTTIQEIAEEYLRNTRKSMESRKNLLRKSLIKIGSVTQEDIDKIVEEVENDAFLNAQVKLDFEYKRTKLTRENINYVGPMEIILNKEGVKSGERKDCLHYVPIHKTVLNVVTDPTFNKMTELKRPGRKSVGKLVDLKDGSVYKESAYFKANPGAYAAVLYSDAVELKNPLGAARGTYKVVQVFYTLADIAKSQRSQIDRLQLVMVFREKLLKKYSTQVIYGALIEDFKKLEVGIVVDFPMTRRIKCGLLCYSSDNLEASSVGGFSACFSSRDICRTCHIQYKDLESHIHDFDDTPHSSWSVEEYEKIVENLDKETEVESLSDSEDVEPGNLFTQFDDGHDQDSDSYSETESEGRGVRNSRGLKSRCPFNSLESFHCVTAMPPDILHDVFEGRIKSGYSTSGAAYFVCYGFLYEPIIVRRAFKIKTANIWENFPQKWGWGEDLQVKFVYSAYK